MTDLKEIRELEIEAFIQATEDPEKVKIAMKNLIPQELQEDNFTIKNVRGVYHNPITVIRALYIQNVGQIVQYMGRNLKESDKRYLFQSIERRLDKRHFYLRFAKQSLYQNKIEIQEEKDTVKVRVGFTKKYITLDRIIQILQEMELIKA
jgi:RNA binding exosome subunit